MPKARRPENKGLPPRWRFTRSAYYYQVPPGQETAWEGKKTYRLGKTLPEAYRAWADKAEVNADVRTVAQLLDRYALEVIPTKAPDTQDNNNRALKIMRDEFGDAPLLGVKPKHIYQYIDRRKVKKKFKTDADGNKVEIETGYSGKTAAKKEINLLSHAFTMAVKWGYIDKHPFKGEVRLEGEGTRDRYVEDREIVECLSIPSVRKKGSVLAVQAYIRLKLLTGMSKGDLLRLTMTQLQTDGIHITRHKTAKKTGKKTIYEWTDGLRDAVEMAKKARPVLSPFLFCNKRGESYIDDATGKLSGWNSMWQRFMDRVLDETEVKERFTDHDLRAKCASDAETLEQARALLSHVDSRITERVYRRRPERVKPGK